ncbi:hypothetical protein [Oceanobacillus sp. CAU 1775]
MRKFIFTFLCLVIISLLIGCSSHSKPELKGFYQSENDVNGYFIQISIQQDDNSFIEYIDNREVDRGTYKKAEESKYIMESKKQNFEINLSSENTFEVIVNKLNDGQPIKMLNIGDIPTGFSTTFDDVEDYEALLGE